MRRRTEIKAEKRSGNIRGIRQMPDQMFTDRAVIEECRNENGTIVDGENSQKPSRIK